MPENNFETMIREFMKSKTDKDFAIITTKDDKFLTELDSKLHFSKDKRIKFVGTVYDKELLKRFEKMHMPISTDTKWVEQTQACSRLWEQQS